MNYKRPVGRTRHHAARNLVIVLALVPLMIALSITTDLPGEVQLLAAVLWILCLAPGYVYAVTDPAARRPIPFFPVVSAIYGMYYALPLVLGSTNNYLNAPVEAATDFDYPIQLAVFGWLMMLLGYTIVALRRLPRNKPVTWQRSHLVKWGFGFLYGGLLILVLRNRLNGITLGGIVQFIVSLQWLGVGILTVLARTGELTVRQRVALGLGVGMTVLLNLATGTVAPIVMVFAVIGFALWIARPVLQLSWIIGAVVVLCAAVTLRGVVIDFRKQVWFNPQRLTHSQEIGLMLKLVSDRVETDGVVMTIAEGFETTAGRSANMDLFANVVRRTPSEVPYWGGETYASLVGSFIPRFLWPDKPTKELGQAFGHRYRILYYTNTTTSINLPILVEFYINFGFAGIILGMLIVGVIYATVERYVNRPGQELMLSLIGLVLLLPLLLIESDFSLNFGGLPLNAVALATVLYAMGRAGSMVTTGTRPGRIAARPLRTTARALSTPVR